MSSRIYCNFILNVNIMKLFRILSERRSTQTKGSRQYTDNNIVLFSYQRIVNNTGLYLNVVKLSLIIPSGSSSTKSTLNVAWSLL